MSCDGSAERRHWTFKQGDVWHRSWTRTSGDRSYDQASLLVQIRTGDDSAATLVASSNPADMTEGVVLIDVSGSDLGAATPIFDWSIEDTTAFNGSAAAWFEAECEVDGELTTFLTHRIWVDPQIAVAEVA